MDQIRRIEEMEAVYDAARAALLDLEGALEKYLAIAPRLRELEKYYTSGQWLRDYQDDEAGKLPRDLKRGVLSQDGVYDLLHLEKWILQVLSDEYTPKGESKGGYMMERWTQERAQRWWDGQPWPLGINYVTSDAVNDVEMWMDATFHPALIEKELGMARGIGYRSVRVFLPYIVWQQEREIFETNFEKFLQLADAAGLSVMPILFDDCAFDQGMDPAYGPQLPPVPGVHNSRWVPSPGAALQDAEGAFVSLQEYVEAIIGPHRQDERILLWDLYNEPGNGGRGVKCLPLLTAVFEWARALDPIQPLTAGLWAYSEDMEAVNAFQLAASDVISLHAYLPLEETRKLVEQMQAQGRPIMITEWLHRPSGNTVATHVPYFRQEKIGAWQWGMIMGRTQTHLSWDTMHGTPNASPTQWQHDILWPDGTPYDAEEIRVIGEAMKD